MKQVFAYLKLNCIVFIFVICTLLFPFIFAYNAYGASTTSRVWINITYAIIVSGVLLCTSGKLRRIIAIGIAVVSYVPNIIVQSNLLMDHVIMKSTDFWVVFNTNPEEANNFFSTLKPIVFIYGTIYTLLIIGSLIILFKTKEKNSLPVWINIAAIVLLLYISIINPFRSKVPMIDFYKSYRNYQKEQKEVAEFYKNRQNIKLDVEHNYPKGRNTLLIIIGESQNQKHMQLYGYTRPTNPLLMDIKDELIIYNDVCAPAIQTLICMKQILTFTNYEHPDMYKKEANIIELLRAGGYKTFWYDNQGGSTNGAFAIDHYTPTSYRTMAKQSDVFQVDGKRNDSVVIGMLASALQDTATNKAIFLHLVGNHFNYSRRYEPNFAYFNDTTDIQSPCLKQLTKDDINVINAYDNATRYNDYIIRTCVEMIRSQKGRSAMLYLSDHGEEVFDYQYYYTRSFEKISPAMCEIPLILWTNNTFRESCHLTIDNSRPICTDDIVYGIMDLAEIRYHLYDSTHSIFSPNYVPKERLVMDMPLQEIKNKYSLER